MSLQSKELINKETGNKKSNKCVLTSDLWLATVSNALHRNICTKQTPFFSYQYDISKMEFPHNRILNFNSEINVSSTLW
jgi:hypothetical protein